MMRLAPTHNSVYHAAAGGSLLLRLRAWFASVRPASVEAASGHSVPAAAGDGDTRRSVAVVLRFPIRGEALLVRLADLLRGRVAAHAAARDRFLLTLSRRPRSRLTIDHAAYVEFHADRATYHLVIDVVQETRIAVETTDFDTVVNFVAQYVTDRLSDPLPMEAAS